MNLTLWIVQVALALVFALAGAVKVSLRREKIIAAMPWAEDLPVPGVRFIGGAELAGAAGLVLPAALGIAEWLTPTAAAALALVMVLAAGTHLRRHEPLNVAINGVLLAMALFVAIERFGPHSF